MGMTEEALLPHMQEFKAGHVDKVESAIKAYLQVHLVDPCIDDMFGTIDVKQLGENLLDFLSEGQDDIDDIQVPESTGGD